MPKLTMIRESENQWMVWNKQNGKVANIISIEEFGYLASQKKRYRVDVNGTTLSSMIDNFQMARGIANRQIL